MQNKASVLYRSYHWDAARLVRIHVFRAAQEGANSGSPPSPLRLDLRVFPQKVFDDPVILRHGNVGNCARNSGETRFAASPTISRLRITAS